MGTIAVPHTCNDYASLALRQIPEKWGNSLVTFVRGSKESKIMEDRVKQGGVDRIVELVGGRLARRDAIGSKKIDQGFGGPRRASDRKRQTYAICGGGLATFSEPQA